MSGKGIIVCLDPGHRHGGEDPGAIGPTGLRESGVALDMACRAKCLMEGELAVVMTRIEDRYVSLRARADIANRAQADLFVSIHCNSAHSPEAGGTEVYHYPRSLKGKRLAGCIKDALVPSTGLEDRGVKAAAYVVLRKTVMPACLVEVAFISNPEEERLLRDGGFRQEVGGAIARGIREYLAWRSI